MQTITITEYLTRKNIEFRQTGKELLVKCLFAECDKNSRQNEAHLYFSEETSQYDCKKCGANGNIFDLAKFLGDKTKDIALNVSGSSYRSSVSKKVTDIILTNERVTELHTALPDHIRLYLNKRGIPDVIINQQKLGWGEFYGRFWITIPVTNTEGAYALLKLRKDPEDTSDVSKMMVYPKGAQHQIYGWEMLKGQISDLVICEGELDRLILLAKGIPAVTGTGGAGTFKDEWVPHFLKAEKVYICFDSDDAGRTGAVKILSRLLEIGHEGVFRIELPDMGDGLKDVTDYLVTHGGNVDTFMKLARRVTQTEVSNRIVKIERPYRPTTFEEWHDIIQANFPDLMFSAEICLAIITQILIQEITNPFALVLVGVPAGGKTICINFFDAIDELTYASDKFTPASFVTNASNVPREKLAELDLLPRIKHKTFLVRDLSILFSKKEDDLNECLGVLTRVLDGEGLSTDTGVSGRRNLSGDYLFMMIAASTPLPSRVWKLMSSLGSRMFFYSMQFRKKEISEIAMQLKDTAFKEKEKACQRATRNLLYTLWNDHHEGITWNRADDPDNVITIIATCADLLAKLRGLIGGWKENTNHDGITDIDYTPPIIEQPNRISILFYNLCRGHAVAVGRKQIAIDDIRLIVELAIDTAPTVRAQLFRSLIDHGGEMTTSQVEICLARTKPIALKEMQTLVALGVCTFQQIKTGFAGQPENKIILNADFGWFLSQECRRIRGVEETPIRDTLSDLVN